MKIPFLELSRMEPGLKEALSVKFDQMLSRGVYSGGEEVYRLEDNISKYLHAPFSVACANGTDALELALRALGIGHGDEVIVPSFTWVSTAEAVVMAGATPVFAEVDGSGLIVSHWHKLVTAKTRAVIPVHLFGKMVDMNKMMSQAKELDVQVIEDAAQAFGAFQDGRAAGTFGHVGCLSFYPTKNYGALGEAGMCLTSSAELAERIRLLANHGQPVRDIHTLIGRNSRIDSIHAGFLNVILNFFDDFQTRRKVLSKIYLERLSGIPDLVLPVGILEESHNAHLFAIQTSGRDKLKTFLSEKGIGTAIHYPQILPDMDIFEASGNFAVSRRISKSILSLPLNPYLEIEECDYICLTIKEFFTR